MKKMAILLFMIILTVFNTVNLLAENVTFTIEVTNVTINGGKVHLAVFFTAEEFRKELPSRAYELNSNSTTQTQQVTLPAGQYLIAVFQDANNNGELDYNFLGIPKEMVGISNYSGRGFPTKNFDRHKVPVDSTTEKVTVRLTKFF